MKDIRDGQEKNFSLQPGDIIFVPESFSNPTAHLSADGWPSREHRNAAVGRSVLAAGQLVLERLEALLERGLVGG